MAKLHRKRQDAYQLSILKLFGFFILRPLIVVYRYELVSNILNMMACDLSLAHQLTGYSV
jgi:hypothetical protein